MNAERTSGTGMDQWNWNLQDWGKENFNASIIEKETQEINKNRETDNNNNNKKVQ